MMLKSENFQDSAMSQISLGKWNGSLTWVSIWVIMESDLLGFIVITVSAVLIS